MKNLAKTYDPKEFEDRIYEEWENSGAFGAEASVIAMVLGVLLSVWFIVKVAKR